MTARRVVSVLAVCLVASATVVLAGPKDKKAPAPKAPAKAPKGPVAPAKETPPAPTPGSDAPAAGSGSGDAGGSAVQMQEDPPPSDMEGTNENPDNPHGTDSGSAATVVVAPKVKPSGYPMEEVLRPITLFQNMSEVSIEAHTQFSPVLGASSLRARYGITRQVQLGLTYLLGGLYDDPKTLTTDKVGFHPGKAVGLDVTVLLQDWLAVRVGVPVYIDPVAVGLQIGAPLKFVFADGKLALGGMDDLLNIKIHKFAPSFYSDASNAGNAAVVATNTKVSNGTLRFSVYGEYQYKPRMAIIGRFGVDANLGDSSAGGPGASSSSSAISFIRAGFEYTVRKQFDAGLSLGFDDLAHGGSFGPQGYLAIRI